jgi:hypothetical protein
MKTHALAASSLFSFFSIQTVQLPSLCGAPKQVYFQERGHMQLRILGDYQLG